MANLNKNFTVMRLGEPVIVNITFWTFQPSWQTLKWQRENWTETNKFIFTEVGSEQILTNPTNTQVEHENSL